MVLYAYSLYDRKAVAYHAPFFAAADGSAVRSVSDLAHDLNTTVGRHPADFVLYRVGAFNDSSGELLSVGQPVHITDCLALIDPAPQSSLFDGQGAGRLPEAVSASVTQLKGKE